MSKLAIGIPCHAYCSPETLEDYMAFAFNLGRRTNHEVKLWVKPKSEQFRARNAIVEYALRDGCDYLLFLDDDHVINWEDSKQVNSRYSFVDKLIEHLQADPKRAIVGALYYKRGGDCGAVLMKEGKDGGYYFMRDDEITKGLQEVAVTGGGCMLIDMNLFSIIPSPWFEPESVGLGTDLQICQKAREAGRTVWCDTSIVLGHVMSNRQVVTPRNRHRVIADSGQTSVEQGMLPMSQSQAAYSLYKLDVQEYLQASWPDVVGMAMQYDDKHIARFNEFEDKREYYRSLDNCQLARQAVFHGHEAILEQMDIIMSFINTGCPGYGLDFGCGSSPAGFEFVQRGHSMDFVDLTGAPAYEFLKWRTERRGVSHLCGWEMAGPYDYALLLDSIEHIDDWRTCLRDIVDKLKPDGAIITNYFLNTDFDNVEHISMDHKAVKEYLISLGVYPLNELTWIKKDLGFMDRKEQAA